MPSQYLGALLIAVSAFGFGLMPIFALYAYDGGASVGTVLSCRFIITAVVFFAVLRLRRVQFSLSKRNLVSLALLGGVFYMLQSTTYLHAVRYISPSLAALILYTFPVMVAIVSYFIEREPLAPLTILAIIISLTGTFFMLGVSTVGVNITGVLLAFSAAIIYTCYIVLSNRVLKQIPSLVASAYVALFAALTLTLISAISGDLNFDITPGGWLAIGGIALFSTVIAMLTFFYGLELVGATKAAVLSTTEPVVTAVLTALLFGERLSLPQLLGGAAVLTGAILAALAHNKARAEEVSV